MEDEPMKKDSPKEANQEEDVFMADWFPHKQAMIGTMEMVLVFQRLVFRDITTKIPESWYQLQQRRVISGVGMFHTIDSILWLLVLNLL